MTLPDTAAVEAAAAEAREEAEEEHAHHEHHDAHAHENAAHADDGPHAEHEPTAKRAASDHADRSAGHDDDDDDDDEDEGDDAEEEIVESVGGDDVLEEVPERAFRPRRQYKIQEVIKRRQVMLVQVVKEERGNKGAALTTYLSLAGRYAVLMPNTARGGGISRKITSAQDRSRLKEVVQDLDVPEGMGIILRTAGASRTKPEIKRDFEYLIRMWETVRDMTLKSQAPTLVYEEGSLIKRSLRDLYNKEIDEILVAGEAGYQEARDFMKMLMPSNVRAVKQYRDGQPLFSRMGVESQLDAMFSPTVQLRSGGARPIDLFQHPPVRADQHRERQLRGAEHVFHLQLPVDELADGRVGVPQPRPGPFRVIVGRDPDDVEFAADVEPREAVERGHLLPARAAPARPDVDDQWLAPELGQLLRRPVETGDGRLAERPADRHLAWGRGERHGRRPERTQQQHRQPTDHESPPHARRRPGSTAIVDLRGARVHRRAPQPGRRSGGAYGTDPAGARVSL